MVNLHGYSGVESEKISMIVGCMIINRGYAPLDVTMTKPHNNGSQATQSQFVKGPHPRQVKPKAKHPQVLTQIAFTSFTSIN